MREYLLYSQIPQARQDQVLSIFAGVTGTQPVQVWQQVAIYGQVKLPEVAVSKKAQSKQQAQRQPPALNYHKLVRDLNISGSGEVESGPWTFRSEALPDPGLTDLIARLAEEHPATEDELRRLKQPELYRFRRQFLTEAIQFIHTNVVIRIYRMLHAPESQDPISSPAPSPKDQKLVDISGSWIIEASLRVEDASNSTLTEKAKQELLAFQETMDGAVDLIAPDRLALDTRVKGIA